MNLKTAFSALTFTILSVWQLAAAPRHFQYDLAGNKFGAPEFRYEVFGTWRVPDDTDMGDGRLGVGLGLNYFFNLHWGIGMDTHLERVDVPNHLNVSVIARYPMETYGTAPYVFAGGGRQYRDDVHWTTHIGGGLDYRMNQMTGVFVDARRTFVMDGNDFFLFRAGLNFRF
jgi:hypothetical protein